MSMSVESGEVAALEALKQACIRAAQEAYEDALQSGLCAEGAFEAAISAIHSIKTECFVRAHGPDRDSRD